MRSHWKELKLKSLVNPGIIFVGPHKEQNQTIHVAKAVTDLSKAFPPPDRSVPDSVSAERGWEYRTGQKKTHRDDWRADTQIFTSEIQTFFKHFQGTQTKNVQTLEASIITSKMWGVRANRSSRCFKLQQKHRGQFQKQLSARLHQEYTAVIAWS